MALEGSERKALHAILHEQGGSQAGYVDDSKIAEIADLSIGDVRDCLETLEGKECVQRSVGVSGHSAYITAKGRQELRRSPIVGDARDESTPRPIKVVPKGLRSYEEEDAYFFLELLPGTRDRDGLPESIRYWKIPIERTDADRTFRVGLIYGPSGSGKSSLVKAGLLPRLAEHVLSIHIEVTADGTEARLLNSLHKNCPELSIDLGLEKALEDVSKGQELPPGKKLLIVLDQFEQWLSTWRGDEESDLFAALRHCDGGHVQAIVLARDDFWMAVNRFEKQLGVEFRRTLNSYGIDLFDPIHAKKVLMDFGRGFDQLPDHQKDLSDNQKAFLDHAMEGLIEKGKVVPVRLSLFAWMVRGKPWTTETLRNVGGAEGVGLNFLEETFNSPHAEPKYRHHQRAAQAVLKSLLPEGGTRIRGEAKSYSELISASGYAHRPGDFEDLCRILDGEVRLITPTAREESSTTDQEELTKPIEQYYQLTHDYLVPSIREWLTRKQRETRRGRAELRLAERSASWNAKPENRHLPSALEWANIRLLTRKKDWNESQRMMMKKAGRIHASRTFAALLLLGLLTWGGVEGYGVLRASDLVESLKTANTTDVPLIIEQLKAYRRWASRPLSQLLTSTDNKKDKHPHLHASLATLALVPEGVKQAAYLHDRLLIASPVELPVIWEILRGHDRGAEERLWTLLENPKDDPEKRFRAACALANSDVAQVGNRWDTVAPFLTDRFLTAVVKNPSDYSPLIENLRPIRLRLQTPLASIFRDTGRSDSERNFATALLTDYARGDPNLVADLLMDADHKAYASLFPIAQEQAAKTLPLFQAELLKKPAYSWNDSPLDSSWTTPDANLAAKIESAQGMLAERFAFCQTMPLEEFLKVVEQLRPSGYRPTRFRPYAEGNSLGVAAVWTRDGCPWRLAHDQSTDEIRQTDERNRKEGYLSVDVAGYLAAGGDEGKPTSRFAALWALRTGLDDDARMVVASWLAELTKVQAQLKNAGLVPLTLHSWRQADDKLSYSGVWHKTATGTSDTASLQNGLSEADLPGVVAQRSGSLIDLDLAAAPPPPSTKERATSALQVAEAALKAKPDDLNARFGRATAHFQLGESQKAIDDLNAVIEKAPQAIVAYRFRAIAHARLGHKDQARADLEKFQKSISGASISLYLALIVAAELGEGSDQAVDTLETALKKQPHDSALHWNAACAYSQASHAVARKDQAKSKSLSERALSLLRKAIQNGYADYKHMQEAVDLDPCRDLPAFADIMKAGHLDRSYAAVWAGDFRFEASPIFGLDTVAQLQRCRELASQGYRMVALSIARTSPEGPPITASVWHRPVITEETKDRLAERQARAAVALLRMGKGDEIMPLLRHSADPRLRSFIVNRLSPLGADARIIAAKLESLPATTQPTPAEGQQLMDAILFHSETSQRRALILGLGTYGTEGLFSGEREPLTGKLLDLYRNDPDAGIHGAAEWTLRQWKQDEKLRNLDAELSKLKDRGNRRWHVNSQGQTFAVIEGPAEFRMGSPPTEPERFSSEILHRRIIPRRFAIATQEVTVEQYQEFVKENPVDDHANNDRYSPDPKGPMNAVSWYHAAAYCNWLSRKENLPECYEPNDEGKYADGMKVRADTLQRTGYRLPTEAEWEYACRAGAVTSRYYGRSVELLGKYAWYLQNSQDRAWPCGHLLPNELGLFDMLGNAYEWCQEQALVYRPDATGIINDDINVLEYVHETNPRILRGGAFDDRPALVRSAPRSRDPSSNRGIDGGFRLARTYP